MYKITALKNGIRCVERNIRGRDSLSIGVWISSGGRYEEEKDSGISHFLEHLLFRGTKTRSAEDIKEAIEGRGGAMNGWTSEEFTCYLVKILSRDIAMAVDILSDMVLSPLISEEDIEKERTVIKEEIKMYMDLPGHYVHEALMEMLWPAQALGRNLAGTIGTVEAISRRDIIEYKENFYTAPNVVIAACGNTGNADFSEFCKKYWTPAVRGKKSSFKNVLEKQIKPELKILSKDTQQTHLAMGARAFGRNDPDRYALSLLNIIMGANMSSRLFSELRDKHGLVYEIGTHAKKFYDTGTFIVSAGLDTKKILNSLDLIMAELKKIKTVIVEKDEFIRAREFYRGQLLLGLEDTSDHMLWMGEYMSAENSVPSPKDVLKKIEKITPDDIMRVAGRIFRDERLNLALIGPVDKKDEKQIPEILTFK